MTEEKEDVMTFEKFKEQFNRKAFVASRLPPKTHYELTEYAKEECCDDYGIAIDKLWTFYKNRVDRDELIGALYEITRRLDAIERDEQNTPESKFKEITMCDGTKRRGGKKDE